MASANVIFTVCLVVMVTNATGQLTPQRQCDSADSQTSCIISYIAEKFEQMNTKIELMESAFGRKFAQLSSKVDQMELNFEEEFEEISDLIKDSQATIRAADCADLLSKGFSDSKVYTIYPPSESSNQDGIRVYCDMTTTGGGWLVFQRRQDGSVDFAQGWNAYRDGFGSPDGELWLGNTNLARITKNKQYKIRIELGDWANERRYAEYDLFRVDSEDINFALTLGQYSGTAGDSFTYCNGAPFSTIDRDISSGGCADINQSGWWFKGCSYALLNDPYQQSSVSDGGHGVAWYAWHGGSYSLKFAEMKIRPVE